MYICTYTDTKKIGNQAHESRAYGWDGWTGYQKCPSIFIILCMEIDPVYMYLYSQKLSPTFLWVPKFDVKLWVGEHNFRNYPTYVSFQIFGSKSRLFSFYFYLSSAKKKLNLKNVIYNAKLNFKVRF